MLPTLITKDDCPNCVAAKRMLTKRGIEVDERNVTTDPLAADIAKAANIMAAPALEVNGKWYRNMHQILEWMKTRD